MARASRCGSTVLEVYGLTAASIDAIISSDKEMDVSLVEFAEGALWAPSLWRRFIYTILSPPYDGPVNCAGGVEVGVKWSKLLWGCLLVGDVGKSMLCRIEVAYDEWEYDEDLN